MQPESHDAVIFLNHDPLDCRRDNLLIATPEQARQHHRVRKDSKSGIKGVRYHPESDSWSAYVYRHGHCYHIGSFDSKEAASAAYEAELKKQDPTLQKAPERVQTSTSLIQQDNPSPPSLSA